MRALPRPIWLVGWMSFATDLASEAIYPLLPLFLSRRLGAGPPFLGLSEGVADATASLLKVVSGRLADRRRRRKTLVLMGYGLSSVARPLMAVATAWWHVLVVRFIDRIGKGIRGAPRDAMLATWAPPAARGWVYGFHRAMDHGGAVVGPLVGAAFLWMVPERALVADLVPPSLRATAFGAYGAVLGVGALAASLVFGLLWARAGPAAAFFFGAALAVSAAFLLGAVLKR